MSSSDEFRLAPFCSDCRMPVEKVTRYRLMNKGHDAHLFGYMMECCGKRWQHNVSYHEQMVSDLANVMAVLSMKVA